MPRRSSTRRRWCARDLSFGPPPRRGIAAAAALSRRSSRDLPAAGRLLCGPSPCFARVGGSRGGFEKRVAAALARHFFFGWLGGSEKGMNTGPTSPAAPLVCLDCHERTLGTVFCSSC